MNPILATCAPVSAAPRPDTWLDRLIARARLGRLPRDAVSSRPSAPLDVSLHRDQLHRVRRPAGRDIRCLEGRLWMTFDNEPADVVLVAGQTWHCGSEVRLLIQALTPARLQVL
jgi:hypothetical protein